MCKHTDALKQLAWEHDIASFARYKALLESVTYDAAKEHCRNNLRRIKEKYPVALKNETIP